LEEHSPEITSFVVRFVHSGPPENTAYRGSILNVQTNQEFAFVRWEEAVAFMRRFVGLPASHEEVGGRGSGEAGGITDPLTH
jgi:hypothetical protein